MLQRLIDGYVQRDMFILHLKECEYRYNIKRDNKDLYKTLLELVRKNPLKLS